VSEDVTVIILCGGDAVRLEGADKPLLKINDQPIIARLSRVLNSIGPILISANRNLSRYRHYGEVVMDEQQHAGPLAGLAAALAMCRTEHVFVCPGDCPDVNPTLARRLLERLSAGAEERPELQGVCAHDGRQAQYLHLALRSDVIASLTRYLASERRSVRGWLTQLRMTTMDCHDLKETFADIDTVAELNARRRI